MRRHHLIIIALSGLLGGCAVGSLDTLPEGSKTRDEGDGGPGPLTATVRCPEEGCPAGTQCIEGSCQAEDPCLVVTCGDDERCEQGFCVLISTDPCADVICNNPGDVCSGGLCVAGQGDLDGDGTLARDDCDDGDPAVHPGALEVCNGVDDNCDGDLDEGFDGDDDGRTSCGGGDPARIDCDDEDPMVFPGAPERCNGVDDNCDGAVDEAPIDVGLACGSDSGACQAGVTACVGGASVCQGSIEPQAEQCDGVDNDCDGAVDDGIAARACNGTCGAGTEQCIGGGWVCDAPNSGACAPGQTETMPCDCGVQTRTCTASCTWGGWSGCSGGTCGWGAVCCDGGCRMDVNSCGGCGEACPSGYRGSCCLDPYSGMVGCCPDSYPVCGGDGYCYAY